MGRNAQAVPSATAEFLRSAGRAIIMWRVSTLLVADGYLLLYPFEGFGSLNWEVHP